MKNYICEYYEFGGIIKMTCMFLCFKVIYQNATCAL